MTRSEPTPDSANSGVASPSRDAALQNLGEAIGRLGGDSVYIMRSLTDMLTAMRPVSRNRLTKLQQRFLIESGSFTADELASTTDDVDRGSLQVGAAEAMLSNLVASMSLEDVASFLDWTEDAVRTAVTEGLLYSVEISGRSRFPVWQLDLEQPNKLIPGLAEVIKAVTPRWDWYSVAGFMSTPQFGLVATGRRTPTEWLRDGGNVADVIEIIEVSDWS